MIPGSNLLNTALSVIQPQTLDHYRFLGRETNAIGLDVASYAAPVQVRGSFQPVPRTKYELLGLDLNKTYFNFYTSASIADIERECSGDQLVFMNKRYQCLSVTPWGQIDGWVAVLCIQIPQES